MFEDHNSVIGELLGEAGLLTAEQINDLNEAHLQSGKSFCEIAIDSELVERNRLLESIAEYLHYDFLAAPPAVVSESILSQVPSHLARMYVVVPIAASETSINVVAKDPFNSQIINDLTFSLNKDITIVVCDPGYVDDLIGSSYGAENESIDDILSDIDTESFREGEGGDDFSDSQITAMANDTPIIRFVNLVLTQAVKDKASDVHFEPFEDQFRIRYRIDGALYEMAPPPQNLALPVISRIKVLSGLNIAERRLPQDGRIKMTIAGRPVDLRVSTLPTHYGESVVLRVLDKSVVNLSLDQLNMPKDIAANIRRIAAYPNGIFIVTGPTGSGKTTTLYSALAEVNTDETKILTAEDPVEYEIEGLMQTAINHKAGLDFPKALRAFLRQDPDKIMIGEIRDLETAQIAVQASLTGHLVMSTLHTNDAAGAITRLIDMGLESYLIAASLEAVLSQRLVRCICEGCRTAYKPEDDLISQLELDGTELAGSQFFYGAGCAECNRTGYRGRRGLYEMIMVSDKLKELITAKKPTLVIKQQAREEGMNTLREDGIRNILDGVTTIEEVLKYT